jgi:hypothetical protein
VFFEGRILRFFGNLFIVHMLCFYHAVHPTTRAVGYLESMPETSLKLSLKTVEPRPSIGYDGIHQRCWFTGFGYPAGL